MDSGLWGVWCQTGGTNGQRITGRVASGWGHERTADYGACGVRLGARTDSGLWGVWCQAGTTNG
jgi:hypothetical protein